MIDPVSGSSLNPPTGTSQPAPTADPATRARSFSSAVAAWISRGSGIRANYAGYDELEDPEPEPLKASAPVISPDLAKIR